MLGYQLHTCCYLFLSTFPNALPFSLPCYMYVSLPLSFLHSPSTPLPPPLFFHPTYLLPLLLYLHPSSSTPLNSSLYPLPPLLPSLPPSPPLFSLPSPSTPLSLLPLVSPCVHEAGKASHLMRPSTSTHSTADPHHLQERPQDSVSHDWEQTPKPAR